MSSNKLPKKLVEGVHFYMENGFMVLSALYLKQRGYCCDNGCRHCPYKEQEGNHLD